MITMTCWSLELALGAGDGVVDRDFGQPTTDRTSKAPAARGAFIGDPPLGVNSHDLRHGRRR
jgi:hypothetical protein